MTLQLQDILTDSRVRAATPQVTCVCGNPDPEKWTMRNCPIRNMSELAAAEFKCDDCYRNAPYHLLLGWSTWQAVRSIAKVMLAQDATGGLTVEKLNAAVVKHKRGGPETVETVDQRLNRLRDENLERMFR